MPQAERAETIKEFLRWLEAKSKRGGASTQECIKHLQTEITQMGAKKQTCHSYIVDCLRVGFICEDKLKFKLTEEGKNWLQRKV